MNQRAKHSRTLATGVAIIGSASFATGSSITLSVGSGRDAVFSGACSTQQKAKSYTFTLTGTAAVSANIQ